MQRWSGVEGRQICICGPLLTQKMAIPGRRKYLKIVEPKPLERAQQAIILRMFGVQVDSQSSKWEEFSAFSLLPNNVHVPTFGPPLYQVAHTKQGAGFTKQVFPEIRGP